MLNKKRNNDDMYTEKSSDSQVRGGIQQEYVLKINGLQEKSRMVVVDVLYTYKHIFEFILHHELLNGNHDAYTCKYK